ncbi:hypothetical protein [Saccharopolyspora gloriosae]|uniref:hypothetical protein n=1 Tax=Saccharopolyspora gloriosae TaxID=455344 RepID=UPI001FB74BAF|nr:hypothetical protein [Saccharopolyspora gloriosae]
MGILSTLDNAGSRIFGYESDAEEQRREHGEEANRIAQQQQAQLAQQNSGLTVNGYDNPAITECVNWSGFDHAQIFRTNSDSIEPGKVGEVAQAWLDFAEGLRGRGENYGRDLQQIVEGGWQGAAADSAKEVGKPASEWMTASADAFAATGNNLNAAGDAAGQASKMVDQPAGYSWGSTAAAAIPFGAAGAGVNALSQMEEQEQAEKAAQETMSRVYSPALQQIDAKMPQYTAPDGSTKEPPPATPPPGTDWGGGPGANGLGNGPGSGIGGGAGSNLPGGGYGGSHLPGGGYGNGSGGPGSTTPSTPSESGSQWAGHPGPGGLPGGGGPGAGGPGAGGAGAGGGMGGMAGGLAGGAGGAGAGGMGRGAGGPGAGGRAGIGGPGAGAAGGGAGARGAGAGRGGMGGGMGGGAGQRGQGGEDAEHERPSWLEEHDDIWMNDMPKTAPPVLGE